jgi:hypothetical protein
MTEESMEAGRETTQGDPGPPPTRSWEGSGPSRRPCVPLTQGNLGVMTKLGSGLHVLLQEK